MGPPPDKEPGRLLRQQEGPEGRPESSTAGSQALTSQCSTSSYSLHTVGVNNDLAGFRALASQSRDVIAALEGRDYAAAEQAARGLYARACRELLRRQRRRERRLRRETA